MWPRWHLHPLPAVTPGVLPTLSAFTYQSLRCPRETVPFGQADLLSLKAAFELPEGSPSTHVCGGGFQCAKTITSNWHLKEGVKAGKIAWSVFPIQLTCYCGQPFTFELLTLVINRWGLESFQFAPGMLSKVYLKFLNFILYYIPGGPVKNLHLLITDSKVGNHQLRMNTFCLTKRWSQNRACKFACDADIAG